MSRLWPIFDQARVNLERIEIRSPVNGWVTNLVETNLEPIRVGDPASIKLMGYRQILRGHVDGIARGINVSNAQPNRQGLANVNPIFTWVRLAQRIPVRIHIDQVPEGVVLGAGMTATVQINPPVKRVPRATTSYFRRVKPSLHRP
jgi:multidrug resistance efflux pump